MDMQGLRRPASPSFSAKRKDGSLCLDPYGRELTVGLHGLLLTAMFPSAERARVHEAVDPR